VKTVRSKNEKQYSLGVIITKHTCVDNCIWEILLLIYIHIILNDEREVSMFKFIKKKENGQDAETAAGSEKQGNATGDDRKFIVVVPLKPKNKMGDMFGVSGSALDLEIASMYGSSLYNSDFESAKREVVKAVTDSHKLESGANPDIRLVKEYDMPESASQYKAYAEKTAAGQGFEKDQYRWEYHKYETRSVEFPVLVIWTKLKRDKK
jgi:hypothetical protein